MATGRVMIVRNRLQRLRACAREGPLVGSLRKSGSKATVTPGTIDVHCHFLPPALIELLEAEGPRHSIHITEKDGKRFASFAGRQTQPIAGGMLDLEERLGWMDQRGIDLQIVSAWMDFSSYVLDPDDGLWLASSLNELTLEAITPHADRFAVMAAVPMQEPKLAAEELRRAVRELGMVGVEIGTSIGNDELDDESLTPFWTEA